MCGGGGGGGGVSKKRCYELCVMMAIWRSRDWNSRREKLGKSGHA